MAKFNSSMLPPPPEPYRISDLAVGQSRFASESALCALKDGTALISLRASIRRTRSWLYPVSVKRTARGWAVAVPDEFEITSTRSRMPVGHAEVTEISTNGSRPEVGPDDYAEGVVGLVVALCVAVAD
jgi:hypothetical protein